MFLCFKHKTGYEMRISDWSSDVCSSDLKLRVENTSSASSRSRTDRLRSYTSMPAWRSSLSTRWRVMPFRKVPFGTGVWAAPSLAIHRFEAENSATLPSGSSMIASSKPRDLASPLARPRSEEHTSELQSLMRNSYAVFCLKKNKKNI